MFLRTQIETGRLTAQYDLIRSKLGIDWLHVTWADLRKPLTSGLAAALFLTLEDAPGNVPVSVTMQATYWLQHYRMVHTGLTEQNFTDRAETLERGKSAAFLFFFYVFSCYCVLLSFCFAVIVFCVLFLLFFDVIAFCCHCALLSLCFVLILFCCHCILLLLCCFVVVFCCH